MAGNVPPLVENVSFWITGQQQKHNSLQHRLSQQALESKDIVRAVYDDEIDLSVDVTSSSTTFRPSRICEFSHGNGIVGQAWETQTMWPHRDDDDDDDDDENVGIEQQ